MFIVVEGIDGAGKGEVMSRLHARLFAYDKRFRLLTTREPTYGTTGSMIREALNDDPDPRSNPHQYLEWYCKDREEHVGEVVQPFLGGAVGKDVHVVLCDRYMYSTLVFQQAQGLSWEEVWEPNAKFLVPDVVVVLDVAPEVAVRRMERDKRGREKFEDVAFMAELRKLYLGLKKKLPKHPIVVVDASGSKSEVEELVWNQIKKKVMSL